MSDDLSIPSPTYRIPRHSRGMDPATRRLALIAGGLGGALLVIIGGWSVMGHRSGAVPVVQADSRPMRVKPENPGGMQIAGANEDILSGGPGHQRRQAGAAAGSPRASGAAQAAATAARRDAAPAPAPFVAAPAAPKAAAPASPKAIAEKPAATPDKHAAAAAPAGKATLVQLAAVSSETAAKTEWERLQKRMPDLLDRHQPAISKTERDGRTLWRVRTGGFADVSQANSFCERVRSKGAGCSVADF